MKKRRAFFFGGPVGASLLIALIPGPCTTFDDLTPPGADAAELDSEPVIDAAPYVPHCGLTLTFAADAQDCQMWLDNGLIAGGRNCCAEELACAETGPCAAFVACANRVCPPGLNDAACAYSDCGTTELFRDVANDIESCKSTKLDSRDSFCRWP
jgi:hypothetical protein